MSSKKPLTSRLIVEVLLITVLAVMMVLHLIKLWQLISHRHYKKLSSIPVLRVVVTNAVHAVVALCSIALGLWASFVPGSASHYIHLSRMSVFLWFTAKWLEYLALYNNQRISRIWELRNNKHKHSCLERLCVASMCVFALLGLLTSTVFTTVEKVNGEYTSVVNGLITPVFFLTDLVSSVGFLWLCIRPLRAQNKFHANAAKASPYSRRSISSQGDPIYIRLIRKYTLLGVCLIISKWLGVTWNLIVSYGIPSLDDWSFTGTIISLALNSIMLDSRFPFFQLYPLCGRRKKKNKVQEPVSNVVSWQARRIHTKKLGRGASLARDSLLVPHNFNSIAPTVPNQQNQQNQHQRPKHGADAEPLIFPVQVVAEMAKPRSAPAGEGQLPTSPAWTAVVGEGSSPAGRARTVLVGGRRAHEHGEQGTTTEAATSGTILIHTLHEPGKQHGLPPIIGRGSDII